MTDKEIIKALECCTGHHKGCNTCAYYNGVNPCTQRLEADALALICRQQAEIDSLKTDKIMLEQNRVTFPERIEIIDNAREQAVSEFAEAMKKKLQNVAKTEIMGREYYLIGLTFIDNLVKEFAKDINVSTNPEQVKGE